MRGAAPRSDLNRFPHSRPAGALLALALLASCGGNAATEPREACIEVEASPNLNFHDGQPHALTLYLYPLIGTLGFEQASVSDLLEGAREPTGMAGPRVPVTVGPGEVRSFREAFPGTASYMGVVANYYRGPNDAEGNRRAVVPARCGWRTPKITLSPQDLLVN